jgi:hypothetical protein
MVEFSTSFHTHTHTHTHIYRGVKGTMWNTTTQVATKGKPNKGVHHSRVHGPRSQFSFCSPFECGGQKGAEAEKRKFHSFKFQHHTVVCVGPTYTLLHFHKIRQNRRSCLRVSERDQKVHIFGFLWKSLLRIWRVMATSHHEGWMVSGHETIFCWVPVP